MTCVLSENLSPLQKFTAGLLKSMERMFFIHRILRSLGHGSGAAGTLCKDQRVQSKGFMSQSPAPHYHNGLVPVGNCVET